MVNQENQTSLEHTLLPKLYWDRANEHSCCFTGSSRYFILESDLFLWPDDGLFFLRMWIWTRLLWLGFVDINRHSATQSRVWSRSRTVTHEWGAFCDRNLSHWISEKGPGRGWGLSEKIIFVDQVRFFFNVTEVSIFLLFRRHTTVN